MSTNKNMYGVVWIVSIVKIKYKLYFYNLSSVLQVSDITDDEASSIWLAHTAYHGVSVSLGQF